MGISELDALALIFGGTVLIHRFYTRKVADLLVLVLLFLGLLMLGFGLADMVIDAS